MENTRDFVHQLETRLNNTHERHHPSLSFISYLQCAGSIAFSSVCCKSRDTKNVLVSYEIVI